MTYYPYFRGKQYDLYALRELVQQGLIGASTVPIIEPVKDSRALLQTLTVFQEHQQPFYLIENPQAGDFRTEAGMVKLANLSVPKAHILTGGEETSLPELLIGFEASAIQQYEPEWFESHTTIVPYEFRILNHIKGPKIINQDAFTRVPRPAYYESQPDELFTTDHVATAKRGFQGFSDFSIDSRIYYEQSFPSAIMALHFVYPQKDELRIHHFLSAEEGTQKEKFFGIMAEVQQWCETIKLETSGLSLLVEYLHSQKFPGMGVLRKAQVMHHLEVVNQVLKQTH